MHMTKRFRDSQTRATGQSCARLGIVAGLTLSCLGIAGCEGNVCKQSAEEYARRELECDGKTLHVPDDMECPEELEQSAECARQCYALPCDTPADEYGKCIYDCIGSCADNNSCGQ
jgi:hypothetical protein